MGKLMFRDPAALSRVALHALGAKQHRPTYGQRPAEVGPALWLVHDEGVYLMSNGEPRDLEGTTPSRSFVAYAQGCDPSKDPDFHETSRRLVGGDDFVELVGLEPEVLRSLGGGRLELHVDVTPSALTVSLYEAGGRDGD